MVSTGGGGFDLPMGGAGGPLAIVAIAIALLVLLWFVKEQLS